MIFDDLKRLLKAPAWMWVCALGPRLILLIPSGFDSPIPPVGDSWGYFLLAQNMLHGVFSTGTSPNLSPETFRTPGYPLFIMAIGAASKHLSFAVALVQSVIGALTALAAWNWLNGRTSRRGAVVGFLYLALDPVILFHTPLLLGETLFNGFVLWALCVQWTALERPSADSALKAGLVWCAGAFVRPITIYLPLLLSALWSGSRKNLLIFIAASYLFPALWIARNQFAAGHAVFSSVGGVSLLRYPAAGIESLRTGEPWFVVEKRLRESADQPTGGVYANDAELSSAYQKTAMPILKAHPFLLARSCFMGTAKLFAGTGLEMLTQWLGYTEDPSSGQFRADATGRGTLALLRRYPGLIPIQFLYAAALLGLYASCVAGLRLLWVNGMTRQCLFLGGALFYLTALSSLQGYYRYRIPMMPFLSVASAFSFGLRKIT